MVKIGRTYVAMLVADEEPLDPAGKLGFFKASVDHVLPQAWGLLLTGLLSLYLEMTEDRRELLTVFPETPTGASLNSLVFILPLFLAATMIYLLVRGGRLGVVKFIVRASLALATFLLIVWYTSKASGVTSSNVSESVSAVISACVTAGVLFCVYKAGGLMHAFSLASVGALIGSFLAHSIPLLSAVALLAALAAYDTLSVYKGPIGRLVESANLREFAGAVFTMGDVTVGMGDMVFYSMLVSVALLDFGLWPYIMSSLGTLLGAYLGIRMLEKRDYFPGLPLAVSAGLLMMFVSVLLTGQFRW